jgi:hypothetical protein
MIPFVNPHPAGRPMEAEQLNLIENSLSDLAARAAELRRYL